MANIYKVGERDIIDLGQYYSNHVSHMISERLDSKSDIAAELAIRDRRIAELERALLGINDICANIGEHLAPNAENLYDYAEEADRVIENCYQISSGYGD